MRLHQDLTYAPIYLELLESLKNFDAEAANSGFEYGTPAVAQSTENSGSEANRSEPEGRERRQDSEATKFIDDRREAMDLTGEVTFNPLAQLENELGQAGLAGSKTSGTDTTHSTTGN